MKTPLWTPSEERKAQSNMARFIAFVNGRYGLRVRDYATLYQWSIDEIAQFWGAFWDYAEIEASKPPRAVIDDVSKMPGAKWFPEARLNFAENLLRYRDEHPALLFKAEDRPVLTMTYAELYAHVARLAAALRAAGVVPGDRIAGFLPNIPEAVVAMLAATSVGAIWSSTSPDYGAQGVLDRFGQIKPRVLFAADGYWFKGKRIDSMPRVREIAARIGELEKIVAISYTAAPEFGGLANAVRYEDFVSGFDGADVQFEQLPFDHPVYVMYSSGTTGLPKCIVQGPGVLLNQLKEHILHTDLRRSDRIFYFTTCSWMMWNWLVSALGVGATLVLFDGNPFYPGPEALWKLAEEQKITVFGTSARYLKAIEDAGVAPGKQFDLASIRTLLSTGSPLQNEQFHFVYGSIKEDLQLASISGGTDLNGCFALGSPLLPVYTGELQCRGLGMKVEIFDDNGAAVREQRGELVCTAPFPSMPLYFWNDPDGKQYRAAYFDVYPNVWRHGDFAELTARDGLIIYGRSDATLNPGGVRLGTADIYECIGHFPEIADSVVVGQEWKGDVRVVLFVQMQPGEELTETLKQRLRDDIRVSESPRHVPAKIFSVPEIPYTHNMKKVELAVKKVISGQEVKNREALRNPACLEHFKDIAELACD